MTGWSELCRDARAKTTRETICYSDALQNQAEGVFNSIMPLG